MITIMFGNEPYFIWLNRKKFKESAEKKDIEVQSFSTLEEYVTFYSQFSILEDGKYATFTAKSLKELDNKTFRLLVDVLGTDSERHLFIEVKNVDERTKFYKELCSLETVRLLPSKKTDLANTVNAFIKIMAMEGITLNEAYAKEILLRSDYLHNDEISLITAKNYAQQLHCVGFSPDAVKRIVPDLRDGKKFELARLIVEGNMQAVEEELDKIKDPGLMILGLLHWALRPVYLNAIGIPYSVTKGRTNAFSVLPKEVLLECMDIITQEQRAVKKGFYPEQVALHMACAKMVSLCGKCA